MSEDVLIAGVALVLGLVLPWRLHLSALGLASRWRTVPDPLASLAVLAATAWAVCGAARGDDWRALAPVAVTAVLAAAGTWWRTRRGFDASTAVLPRWYVPAVLAVAGLGLVLWSVLDGPGRGASAAAAALVMAAPAAALVAVPAALAAGATRARAAGATLGGIASLEAAARVDTLVLAKNGVLTTGDLTVLSVDPHDPDHDRNIRWFAGALEKASDHPIGRAISTLSARGRLEGVEVVPGHGIRGSVDRHPVRVGTPSWVGVVASPTIWTTVGVEVDGRALGSITLADDVRPELGRDVPRLTALGLRLVLVCPDPFERAEHVAGQAGIDELHAPAGPGEMSQIVSGLAAEGRQVATVGLGPLAGSVLTIAATDTATGPRIVVTDCAPARVADALAVARRTHAATHRARRATVALSLLGAAVALVGVGTPLVAALVAAVVAGSSVATARLG